MTTKNSQTSTIVEQTSLRLWAELLTVLIRNQLGIEATFRFGMKELWGAERGTRVSPYRARIGRALSKWNSQLWDPFTARSFCLHKKSRPRSWTLHSGMGNPGSPSKWNGENMDVNVEAENKEHVFFFFFPTWKFPGWCVWSESRAT